MDSKNRCLMSLGLTMGLATPSLLAETNGQRGHSGYESAPGFSGPTSTSSQLAEDDADKDPAMRFPAFDRAFTPWFDWKRCLKDQHGLELGFAYTSLFQAASDAPSGAEDTASSGIFRLTGKWTLLNRGTKNSGSLVFSADHRHRYDDLAPADLGFSSGYLGIPGTLFNDAGNLLGDLNWQQSFNDGQSGFVIGRYDPNDFLGVLGYANPWTSFSNLSILFDASIAIPDFSTGIAAGHWINEQWYLKGTVNDVNGTVNDIKFFDDFDELYSSAEIGWSPSRAERYLKNIHIMGWHADARDNEGVAQSEGVTVGANWTWDEKTMLFTKVGFSSGAAPLYSESATLGAMRYISSRSDLTGIAVNWGSPADGSLEDQWSSELFYRFQLAENLAITPAIQLIVDPALNPDEDEIWIGSLRTRFTF